MTAILVQPILAEEEECYQRGYKHSFRLRSVKEGDLEHVGWWDAQSKLDPDPQFSDSLDYAIGYKLGGMEFACHGPALDGRA